MINICSWNYRGARTRTFPRLVKELRKNYGVQALIIIEPRVSSKRADTIVAKLGYDKSHRVEVVGFSGGIWILWKDRYVDFKINSSTSQIIHSFLTDKEGVIVSTFHVSTAVLLLL